MFKRNVLIYQANYSSAINEYAKKLKLELEIPTNFWISKQTYSTLLLNIFKKYGIFSIQFITIILSIYFLFDTVHNDSVFEFKIYNHLQTHGFDSKTIEISKNR